MKIDSSLPNVGAVQPKSKTGKGRANERDNTTLSTQDNVDLTTQASLMHALERSLAQMPDTDVGKVEEVRSAIAEGRFQVNEEVVAEKLVENTIEQLHHASKRA